MSKVISQSAWLEASDGLSDQAKKELYQEMMASLEDPDREVRPATSQPEEYED